MEESTPERKDDERSAFEAAVVAWESRFLEGGPLTEAEQAEVSAFASSLGEYPDLAARMRPVRLAAGDLDKPQLPEIDADLEERLARMEQKVGQSLQARQNKAREAARAQKADQESSRGLGVGLFAAYSIIICPLIGLGAGWLVDKAMGTRDIGIGLGTVAGAVLGVWVALHAINKGNRSS